MRTKTEVLQELRTMLRDIFTAKAAGETHGRLARAHGYVDGYMRAVMETGLATKDELLEIVATERERVSGPAIRPLVTVTTPTPALASSTQVTATASSSRRSENETVAA
jgi:hypothetical protein